MAEEGLEGALGDAAGRGVGGEGVLGAGVEAHLHADPLARLDPGAAQARPGPAAARPDPAAAPRDREERLGAETGVERDVVVDPFLERQRHGQPLHLARLGRADRRVQPIALAGLAHREPAVVVVGHIEGNGLARPQAHQRHGEVGPSAVLRNRVEDLVLGARRERRGGPLRWLRPRVLARQLPDLLAPVEPAEERAEGREDVPARFRREPAVGQPVRPVLQRCVAHLVDAASGPPREVAVRRQVALELAHIGRAAVAGLGLALLRRKPMLGARKH